MMSLLSCVSGTPAEKYKDSLVPILKKMIADDIPIGWDSVNSAIKQYNKDHGEQVLTHEDLGVEFYRLVPAAVWKAIMEGELVLALSSQQS